MHKRRYGEVSLEREAMPDDNTNRDAKHRPLIDGHIGARSEQEIQRRFTGGGRDAPGDTDDLIDVLRTARNVDVAAVLKQQRDGRFKVSVRSRGGHDLSAVASSFGGGGHRLAAGYTSEHGPEGTIERLVAALRLAS